MLSKFFPPKSNEQTLREEVKQQPSQKFLFLTFQDAKNIWPLYQKIQSYSYVPNKMLIGVDFYTINDIDNNQQHFFYPIIPNVANFHQVYIKSAIKLAEKEKCQLVIIVEAENADDVTKT